MNFSATIDAEAAKRGLRYLVIASLEHLIALKLHTLKNTRAHRFLKDFLDVENLIRINQLDVKSPTVRTLFHKYGTQDLYEKISRSLAKS